jgi:hypothetical protein
MKRSRLGYGLTAAALAVFVIGVGSTAAADAGDVVIATQDLHKTLVLGDVAADNAIGVVYQKGNRSYLRWSEDGGQTFNPEWSLRAGSPSKSPRLASCGNWMWASSIARTSSSGATRAVIDYLDVTHPESTAGRFRIEDAFLADVACRGDVLAVAYSQSPNLMLAIMDGHCTEPCTPAFTTMISPFGDEPSQVAAVSDGFVVTWPDGSLASGLRVQHFTVTGSGGSIVVTPDPVVTLMPGKQISRPVIDGDGSRVVVAYGKRGQTHMRISDDGGQTFGPRIIVSHFSTNTCCAGSQPLSVDARNGRILVEVGRGLGDPPAISAVGRLTSNDGGQWTSTRKHGGATQIGVLIPGFSAEAWDSHHYASPIYGDVPQEIAFRKKSLP